MKKISNLCNGLKGIFPVPGDKSVSHRALMLGALARGRTEIRGLLEGEDVLRTADAMRALGAFVEKRADGVWVVEGRPLREPAGPLYMGNAGTGTRLLAGLVSSYPFKTTFTGDPSLSSRPMKRITEPLSLNGAVFETTGGKLPMTVFGTGAAKPIRYRLPVASAQVKSAILLAGLNADGETVVEEPVPCRDHTERMLKAFGADIRRDGESIVLRGKAVLTGQSVDVPADISSAAFPIVAALITPDSELVLKNVGLNPLRAGILDVLAEMGARIVYENRREMSGEPVADLRVFSSELRGVSVPADKAPSMIDEYPILAVAAAFAKGESRFDGLAELRVKESDRFEAILQGLSANGAAVEADGDSLIIKGCEKKPCGGGVIRAKLDHRIAMSFMVMGTASQNGVVIDDDESVSTSFPDFAALMNERGANIHDYRD